MLRTIDVTSAEEELLQSAHIISVSYLGTTDRRKRLRAAIFQQKVFRKVYPHRVIVTLASGYTPEEKKRTRKYRFVHLDQPRFKHEKQAYLFNLLYSSDHYRAVLYLDDDALPYENAEKFNTKTFKGLEELFRIGEGKTEERLPYPMLWFGSHGLLFDAFGLTDRQRKGSFIRAPIKSVGWATMIDTRANVRWEDEDIIPHWPAMTADDLYLRCKAEVVGEGRICGKSTRIFFESVHGTSEKASTMVTDHEQRKLGIQITQAWIVEKFPNVFYWGTDNKTGVRTAVRSIFDKSPLRHFYPRSFLDYHLLKGKHTRKELKELSGMTTKEVQSHLDHLAEKHSKEYRLGIITRDGPPRFKLTPRETLFG